MFPLPPRVGTEPTMASLLPAPRERAAQPCLALMQKALR